MGTKCRGRITQPGRRKTGGVAVMMESAWPALTSALPLGAVSALPKDSTGSPGLLPKATHRCAVNSPPSRGALGWCYKEFWSLQWVSRVCGSVGRDVDGAARC